MKTSNPNKKPSCYFFCPQCDEQLFVVHSNNKTVLLCSKHACDFNTMEIDTLLIKRLMHYAHIREVSFD